MSPIRLRILALVALTSLGAGCTSAPRSRAYESAVEQAFHELEQSARRSPASVDLKARRTAFSSLRGRTEILVFPKVSNQAAMSREEELHSFASPIRFAVTAQRLLSCRKLLQEKTTQWAHRDYFPADISSDLDCGIFELQQVAPKVRASQRKREDITAARLYLDSNYRPYGLDLDIYQSRNLTDTRRIRWASGDPSSSGLTLLPMDLPLLDQYASTMEAVSIPDDAYLRNQLKKRGARACPRARTFRYRDGYGNRNVVSWCEGDAWPTTVENQRFFAITVRN